MSYNMQQQVRALLNSIEPSEGAEARMLNNIRKKAETKNDSKLLKKVNSGRITKWAVSVAACLGAVLIGAIVLKGDLLNTVNDPAPSTNLENGEVSHRTGENGSSCESITVVTESAQAVDSDTFAEMAPEMTETDAGLSGDGEYNETWPAGFPELSGAGELVLIGESITDSEAALYFEENYISIRDSLSASGVPTGELYISEKGYCHITVCTESGQLEIRQNSRDYLVYNGDRLVAVINLYKDNGLISNSPMFGAAWFEEYDLYLERHKGEKLLYLYAGMTQIIIAPDNSCFNPMGYDVSGYLSGIDDPYELFYNETAVYIP